MEKRLVLALDRDEPADARPDVDADVGGVLRRDRQLRIVHRELRGRDRILDEEVHLLDVLLLDERQRVEPFDLRGNLGLVDRDVEPRNAGDAALAGQTSRPGLLGPDAERRHQSDAGYDDAPVQAPSGPLARYLFPRPTSSPCRAPRCNRWLP